MEDSALTTIDNPFNPFTHFDEWFAYDTSKGYNTCGLISRIIALRNDEKELLNDEIDEDIATIEAMNEIIENDPIGKYIKVFNEQ